jgi:hypothetical protein
VTYIPLALRRYVSTRVQQRCEYCLLPESVSYWPHECDHIYAEKHGGETMESNLSLSCVECNRYKGTDLCSLDPQTGEIVRLFHPRRDLWGDHFQSDGGRINSFTPIGRVTQRVLRFNDHDRITERETLIALGRYP